MSILDFLLSTPFGTFYAGAFLSAGLVLSCLSMCFYFFYGTRTLLLYGALNPLALPILLFINYDPRILLDANGDPLLLRLLHFGAGLLTYLIYKLAVETSHKSMRSHTFCKILKTIVYAAIVARVVVVLSLAPKIIQFTSILTAGVLLSVGLYSLSIRQESRFQNVSRVSLVLISTFSFYSIVRSGLFSVGLLDEIAIPGILLGVSLNSVILFVCLVEISREKYQSEQQRRIQTLIELKDLMNTPIQVLTLGLDILNEQFKIKTIQQMKNAVDRLSELNQLLNKHQ